MAFLTFKGGIHPYDGKALTKDSPAETYLPRGEMVYPLSQHIGAPASPAVQKGDYVKRGQKIGEAGGFVSAPVHASVSGIVKGMEPRLGATAASPAVQKGDYVKRGQKIGEAGGFVSAPVHASVSGIVKGMEPRLGATGTMANSIIIENDGKYEETEYVPARLEELTKEEILKRIQDGGVVGMGGAGFPTHVKLSPKMPEKIEYVLVNGAECEPYLTSNYRKMLDEPEEIVEGLRIMLALFENAKGYICIEDNKPDCIEKMKELVKDIPRMEVKELLTKYPQGGERTLIYATTGREINSSMLPADVGCVVDNVDTVAAIYRAVILGEPVIDKVITVTGDGIKTPKNFKVCTGTDLAEVVEAAGGLKEGVSKVIAGGPMMGFAM